MDLMVRAQQHQPTRRLRLVVTLTCLLPLSWLHAAITLADMTLTILHTSEHHGAALPFDRRGGQRGQHQVGGLASRATLVTTVRHQTETLLVLDSGDILIGTPLSSFFRGEPDIKAMNLIGYSAMTAGNHDFDFGLDHLRQLRSQAEFPILCSNLTGRATDLPCQRSAVVRTGSLTVGVIGLLGRSTFPDAFNRTVVNALELQDPAETARALALELIHQQQVDLVVALTHESDAEDLALLSRVPEITVVIGGHTEGFDGLRTAGSSAPVDVATDPGPMLVKTHRQGRTVGRLDLTLTDGAAADGARKRVVRARARNLPVTSELPPHPAVTTLLTRYTRKLEQETALVIGRALVDLEGDIGLIRTRETNLGDLLTDLLRAEFGTEVALVNGGQIRDSIPAGPIDLKRLLQVLPFNSSIVTLTITGSRLAQALEHSVGSLPEANGRFLQVSGLTLTYDPSAPAGSRIRELTVGGRPLEPTRAYTVATDAFLADGGDGYTMFSAATDRVERQVPLRDLLLQAVRSGTLTASTDGRIRFADAPRSVQPAPLMQGP